jgi:hypothetical protein
MSWAATLAYQTSGGYGITFNTLPGFGTTNGVEHDETYQSEGGQVQTTASTTASDGSNLQDCVTFYIDGPQTGIPSATITGQLDSLYQHSQSYPTDGTATPNLMTGIAERESTYTQFRTHAECNADLFNLYANYRVLAKWPFETELAGCISDGGTHIGLMQVVTATNQTTDPNAWKWRIRPRLRQPTPTMR